MVTKVSTRATLVQMKAGTSVLIPWKVCGYNSVRSCAATLSVTYPGRKYSVKLDRGSESCQVTRLS